MDEYYNKEIKVDFSSNKTQDGSEELELNDKLKSKIETILVDGLYQLDLIVLFYISFFDLSSQLKNYLSQKTVDISIENIVKSCDNLLENPIIIKSGIFAFLEILDKIFTKLNLDSKNVKIMDIRNLNSLKNVNDILNSLDSEIVEK
ncbi:MAG: hypothetical protein BWY04_00026 [candidate division CPR1 bacterium ADurb.Bin160]|uniref:Uncharacterized protein n=1 Tax=candidate division CPR1 bacterium ADurb.Bin160 TaxID=1852826 RepID=A0A1V5ZQI2_9BACT|nr:MAG: hypothetical protein BWY04_00026 [candidate division CPR1 bacterium ADurb.Bin160]